MHKNMFIGIIGIITFLFATIAMLMLVADPLVRYAVFEATGGRMEHQLGSFIIRPIITFAVANYLSTLGIGIYLHRQR